MENMELINENVVTTEETVTDLATDATHAKFNTAVGISIGLGVVTLGGYVLYKKVIKPWRIKRKAEKAAKANDVAETETVIEGE